MDWEIIKSVTSVLFDDPQNCAHIKLFMVFLQSPMVSRVTNNNLKPDVLCDFDAGKPISRSPLASRDCVELWNCDRQPRWQDWANSLTWRKENAEKPPLNATADWADLRAPVWAALQEVSPEISGGRQGAKHVLQALKSRNVCHPQNNILNKLGFSFQVQGLIHQQGTGRSQADAECYKLKKATFQFF